MPIELVPLCTIDIKLGMPTATGIGPRGLRLIGPCQSGRFEGRISGDIVGDAADWSTVSPDGKLGSADIRMIVRTDDGANILVEYLGRNYMETFPGPVVAHVTPLFETGDERYQWLNHVVAIGKGVMTDLTDIHYEWYEVTST